MKTRGSPIIETRWLIANTSRNTTCVFIAINPDILPVNAPPGKDAPMQAEPIGIGTHQHSHHTRPVVVAKAAATIRKLAPLTGKTLEYVLYNVGGMLRRSMLIPAYIPIQVRRATGIENMSQDEWLNELDFYYSNVNPNDAKGLESSVNSGKSIIIKIPMITSTQCRSQKVNAINQDQTEKTTGLLICNVFFAQPFLFYHGLRPKGFIF